MPRIKKKGPRARPKSRVHKGLKPIVKSEINKRRSLALAKYPWDEIREDFVNSVDKMSLRVMAERWNVPYDQLRVRAGRERWTYQRVEAIAEAIQKKRQSHLTKMANEAIKFDTTSLDAARIGVALVTGRLTEIYQEFQASSPAHTAVVEKIRAGKSVTWGELRSVINYKELGELARALAMFQEVGMKALGTDIHNIDVNVKGEVGHKVSVRGELGRDDPNRVTALLEAINRTGLLTPELMGVGPKVIEGTTVEVSPNGSGNGHHPIDPEDLKEMEN